MHPGVGFWNLSWIFVILISASGEEALGQKLALGHCPGSGEWSHSPNYTMLPTHPSPCSPVTPGCTHRSRSS